MSLSNCLLLNVALASVSVMSLDMSTLSDGATSRESCTESAGANEPAEKTLSSHRCGRLLAVADHHCRGHRSTLVVQVTMCAVVLAELCD